MFSRRIPNFIFFLFVNVMCSFIIIGGQGRAFAGNEVVIIEFEGTVNPGTAIFVSKGLDEAMDWYVESLG